MAGKETYVVTSALPYVNGVKHIGNVVGSLLPADVFARFLRLEGHDVIYICGTDEHGAPSELAALQEGLPVREYCEKYYAIQKDVYERWGLAFDYFGRTSSPENHATTVEIFKAAQAAGYVAEREMLQPFCLEDGRFLADRFIEGTCPHCGFDGARGDQCEKCGRVLDPIELKKPRCNICRKDRIEFRKTKHLFLRLDKLSPQLKEWISAQGHWPANARNFALQWIASGLKERCITRDLSWGVKVPVEGYEGKVFYVWFDAPIGYISFTKEWAKQKGKPEDWTRYWRNKSARIVHVLGKDNVAFHTVIWPGMLIASGYSELPYQVKSLEFLNLEGRKFSTSRNWGIDSREALEWLPADYWRYYLLSILPEGADADFSFVEFRKAANSDLADTLGNLVHRCLTFINSNFDGKVPAPLPEGNWSERDKNFVDLIGTTPALVAEKMHSYRWQEALRDAMALAREANKYFNDCQPWKKAKGSDAEKAEAATCLYLTASSLKALAIVLSPFIPFSSQRIFDFLGQGRLEGALWGDAGKLGVKPGAALGKVEPLFRKVEPADVEKMKSVVEARSVKR